MKPTHGHRPVDLPAAIAEIAFESLPAPAVLYETGNGCIVDANAAFLHFTGHNLTWLKQRRWSDLFDSDGRLSVASGEKKSVEVVAADYLDKNRRTKRLVLVHDISAQTKAVAEARDAERRARDLFEHGMGLVCTHDMAGTLLSINPAASKALGYRLANDLIGRPMVELMAPATRAKFPSYLQRLTERGHASGLLHVLHRDGHTLVWTYHNRLLQDSAGKPYIVGHAQDITQRLGDEQRLRTITDALPVLIAFADANERLVFANTAYENAYGLPREHLVGKSVKEIMGEALYAKRKPYLQRALAGEQVRFEDEQRHGKETRCYEFTYIPQWDEDRRRVIGIHALGQDMTHKAIQEQSWIRAAETDGLTGLLNRAAFLARLERALQRARDQRSMLAVFYLDIDRFKCINDTHGHGTGDALLAAFAQRLRAATKTSDIVGRLGGDEFAVVSERVSRAPYASAAAARIVVAMRAPFTLDPSHAPMTATASVGAALSDGQDEPERLLARADRALYIAKNAGKNRYHLSARPGDAAHTRV